MRNRKLIGAAAMTVALGTGGIVGAVLGNPLTSSAQDAPTSTTVPAAPSGTPAPGDHGGRGPGGRGPGGGVELDAAAKAKGVDKQKLIDALVTAGEKRLADEKAALPDRIAKLVDGTFPAGGPGGGSGRGPGGPGGRGGMDLSAAAKVLGVTEDALRTDLQAGKTLADVAKAKGVDEQDLIDALVAQAKTRIAAEVEDGHLTQAQADERLQDLEAHIADRVTGTAPAGRPDGPPDGDRGGN